MSNIEFPQGGLQGLKIKAGQLLTKFIRDIANEKIEIESNEGKKTLVTKAEALARTVWKLALGYTEEVITIKDGKTLRTRKYYKPDPSCIDRIYERLEGKVPLSSNKEFLDDSRDTEGFVNDQLTQRLNRIAKEG
jgi:hypothetical protein